MSETVISRSPVEALPPRQHGERLHDDPTPSGAPTDVRPVVLGTLSVRIEPSAERIALDAALETGAKLLVANMLMLQAYPLTVMLAPECATLPHEEDLDEVRALAGRAAKAGVATELLRVSTPTPVKALLALTRERRAGLLVFGPDRTRVPRWRMRFAVRTIRRSAPCLVWIASD